jgi:hypothetical protein
MMILIGFTELKDNQVKTCKELIDAFMEKWKDKAPTDIKTFSLYNKYASPDSKKVLKDVFNTMKFIYAK